MQVPGGTSIYVGSNDGRRGWRTAACGYLIMQNALQQLSLTQLFDRSTTSLRKFNSAFAFHLPMLEMKKHKMAGVLLLWW